MTTFMPVLALIAAVLFVVAIFFSASQDKYQKLIAAGLALVALSLWR